MLYEANTPKEYFTQLDDDWRKEKLLQVRSMILQSDPDLVEGIEYKMLSYGNGQQTLFNLNAQRAYVSLYIGNIDKIDKGRTLLNEFDLGKGCIRIKKKVNLEQTQLSEFIKKAIDFWRAGGDTDC